MLNKTPKIIKEFSVKKNTYIIRYITFECIDCGAERTIVKQTFKNGQKYCKNCAKKYHVCQKHGLSKHPLYGTWLNMKGRCRGKDARCIADYQSKGIKVCDEWKDDFKAFFDWSIANGYDKGLTIDRIDSDGEYKPSNCRWATPTIQARNQVKTPSNRKTNTSGYTGVWYCNTTQKWKAEIRVDKKKVRLGTFKTAKDGAIAYDNYISQNNLEGFNKNFKIINTLEADFKPPSVNHLYKTFCRGKTARRVMTKEGKQFKQALGLIAKSKKFKLIETDCVLEYNLYTKKKGRTDLDNTFKAIQDALEGIAYVNDSQVVEIIAKKYKNSGRDGFQIVVSSV